MLANVSHPLWKDKSFDKEMSAYLGTLAEGCTENILLVEKRLRSIESEGQELTEMIGGPDKVYSPLTSSKEDQSWENKSLTQKRSIRIGKGSKRGSSLLFLSRLLIVICERFRT